MVVTAFYNHGKIKLIEYHQYSFFNKKSAHPMFSQGQALFVVNDAANLVMVCAPALGRIIDRFNNAVGHPHAKDRQRVPQTAHK